MKKALPLISIILIAALLAVSLGMIRYLVNSFEENFNRLAATVADTNPQQLERAREILSEEWSFYKTWQCGGLFGSLAICVLIAFVCYYPKMLRTKLVKFDRLVFAIPSAGALLVGALGAYIDWISIVPILDEILIGELSVAWRVLISSTHIGVACSLTITALWLIYFLFAPEREEASEQ